MAYHDMYYESIKNLSDEQWEFLAQDYFWNFGHRIEKVAARGSDLGADIVTQSNNQKYLVSCKHFINSGRTVSKKDENDILDRLSYHGCKTFVCFYSTGITEGLQQYLMHLREQGIGIIILSYSEIVMQLPNLPHIVLQKYFPHPHEVSHWCQHVEYIPLPCLECGKDILLAQHIHASGVFLYIINEQLYLIYGW